MCYNENMDFNTKLQHLRTKKGLTQEQLAEKVCVSRVAVSKWEAGRGYPNLDSLKMLAKVFDVSIDALLSSEELLDIAEVHSKNKSRVFRSLLLGIMDFMTFLLFVLPVCANRFDGKIFIVTLQNLVLVNEVDKSIDNIGFWKRKAGIFREKAGFIGNIMQRACTISDKFKGFYC